MDELASDWVVGDDHKRVCWVELLTKFDDALKVVVEYLLAIDVKLALTKSLLVSLHHHEDHLLIIIWALKEVLEITLLLNLLLRFLDLVHLFLVFKFQIINLFETFLSRGLRKSFWFFILVLLFIFVIIFAF